MEKASSMLEAKSIKPSIVRVKVMQYLMQHQDHPTVDNIYRTLAREVPTLSKTTVYNALKLFQEADLVKEINVGDHENRYDVYVEEHAHFKCHQCGEVYDIKLNLEHLHFKDLENFKVYYQNIYFRGVCPSCLVNGKDENCSGYS